MLENRINLKNYLIMNKEKRRIGMRTKAIMLFWVLCFSSGIVLHAQNQRVNVKGNNITLKSAFSQIEQQTKLIVGYEQTAFNENAVLKGGVKSKILKDALAEILEGTNCTFRFQNNHIYIYPVESNDIEEKQLVSVASAIKITGVVVDTNGEPLIGASIMIKGTSVGTITDIDGRFSLDAVPDAVLTVSSVGYIPQDINIRGRSDLWITLQEDNKLLDELVVVGYGTVKKSDLTGAVSSVKADNLPISSNASIATMLSGKAAGVTSRQVSAQPGGGVEILIRGAASTGAGNEPLYIIDGFPVGNQGVEPSANNRYSDFGSRNPLNSINPNDIESIEILKDASSSAIYGARAANGVVLITTKKGKEGKAIVTYNGSYGIQQIANRIEMMNANQYMNEVNKFSYEKWLFDNRVYPYGNTDPNSLTPWSSIYSETEILNAGVGTDWYSLITRNGMINQHNLSISGGTEKLKHMVSFNYFDQEGVVKNSDFTRFTGRANLEHKLNNVLTYGINATISYINNTNTPLGTEDFENSGLINSALAYDPTIPVKDDKGNYVISPYMTTVPNPVSMLEITDYTKNRRFLINAFVQAQIAKGLEGRINLGLDDQQGNRNAYLPKTTLYGAQVGGNASKSIAQRFDRLIEGTLTYDVSIKDVHKFNMLLGYSYQDFGYEGLDGANSQFFTDIYLYNSLSAGEAVRPTVSSSKSEEKLMSFFGRVNYNLLDRYLLTLTLRADGSSNFGINNRFGYFPSGALAWRINQEEFLQPYDWVSDLKLRIGFGQTGNSNIGNGAYEFYTSAWRQYVFNETVYTGTAKYKLANPDLKWETTTELNVGLDFGFFNQRVSGSFDFFNKQVKDLLGTRTLKSFMEVSSVAANIGKTQSRGVELTLRTINFNKKFKWNTEFNFTRYVDRWLERDPESTLSPWQKNDDPIRAYYTYVADGILGIGEAPPAHMPNLLPGQFKVKDINGYVRDDFGNLIPDANGKIQYIGKPDGILDQADIVLWGTTDPGFSIGFGNTFEYKGIDLNIFFYGMFDRLVSNQTRGKYSIPEIRRILNGQNFMTEVMDRWSHTNSGSQLPSGFTTTYPQPGTYLWEDGWFIRCKNITLGYTIPEKWHVKNFSKARVFFDVGNPFVFTAYTGNDPETDFKAGYPNQHSFMMGIDVTF